MLPLQCFPFRFNNTVQVHIARERHHSNHEKYEREYHEPLRNRRPINTASKALLAIQKFSVGLIA